MSLERETSPVAPVFAASLPQPCAPAWQVMGTPAPMVGLSSLPVNVTGVELRASSKDHKAVAMLVAWQRDTVHSCDI